jgi:hypothetical protein
MPADEPNATLDGKGGAEEGRPAFIEFVSMNASSHADKRRNQKVIRSTAMKNFRRRQQSQRTQTSEASGQNSETRPHHLPRRTKEKDESNEEDSTEHKEQHSNINEEFHQDLQEVPSQAVDDWATETTSIASWLESRSVSDNHSEGPWDNEALQVERSPSHPTSNDLFASSSPLDVLGGGRIDPFRIYPAAYVGPHVHELIDHCKIPVLN